MRGGVFHLLHSAYKVSRLTATFPDSQRAELDLNKFAKLNENRLHKLLRSLMDQGSDLRTIINNHSEVLRRIEASAPAILETFITFVNRSGLLVINQSSITQLLLRIWSANDSSENAADESDHDFAGLSEMLLDMIAKHKPELFLPHTSELAKALAGCQDDRLCRTALCALSAIGLWYPEKQRADRRVLFF